MFNRFLGKKVCSLVLVLIFVVSAVPIHVHASPARFNYAIRTRFIEKIMYFGNMEINPYTHFALHDFDNDGIPELLMGRNNHPAFPLWVFYIVWKYDVLGDRFVHIGTIEETRYLMRDRFSNALIAVNVTPGTPMVPPQVAPGTPPWPNIFPFAALLGAAPPESMVFLNYYITNNRLERNVVLSLNSNPFPVGIPGVPLDGLIENTMIQPGARRNDVLIGFEDFVGEAMFMLGTYREVIVHDWRGFDQDAITATVAVNTWEPHVIPQFPIPLPVVPPPLLPWEAAMLDMMDFIPSAPPFTPMFGGEGPSLGPAETILSPDAIPFSPLDPRKEYQRFALYDIDGDGIPELFLGWLDLQAENPRIPPTPGIMGTTPGTTHFSWDVYRWWMGQLRFIGSFDSYAKYMSRVTNSRDILVFDPVPSMFFESNVRRVSFADNALAVETLLAVHEGPAGRRFLEASRYCVYTDQRLAHRYHLEDIAGRNDFERLTNLRVRLAEYVRAYTEIRTFDIEVVPLYWVLIFYRMTNGFTLPGS